MELMERPIEDKLEDGMEVGLPLEVKNAAQASTSSANRPKNYWEKILVAMDVTLERIRKLGLLSSLCLCLAEDNNLDSRKFTRSGRNKLNIVLGKQVSGILGELVSCQKNLNYYDSSSIKLRKLEDMTKSEARAELIRRLRNSPEKRQFLTDVLHNTKAFLVYMSSSQIDKADNADAGKEQGLSEMSSLSSFSSSASPLKGIELATLTNQPRETTMSAVKLLQEALRSKYKRHVRRCFQELDVESLMNILYLTYEDLTKKSVSSELELRSQFRPSFSYDEDEYFDVDPDHETNSDMDKYLFDNADEFNPFPDDDSFLMDNWDVNATLEKSFSSKDIPGSLVDDDLFQVGRDETEDDSQYLENVALLPGSSTTPSTQDQIIAGINNAEQTPDSVKCNMIKLYMKLLELSLKTQTLDEIVKHVKGDNFKASSQLYKLTEYLLRFRSIAKNVFAAGEESSKGAGTEGRTHFKNSIEYKLLLIGEAKLQVKFNKTLAQKGKKGEELDDEILRWKDTVEEATRGTSISVKSYIKEHVETEMANKRKFETEVSQIKRDLDSAKGSLSETMNFVKLSTKSLRARRHYLEASLDSLIRQYENTMLKYQVKLDELKLDELANSKEIAKIQKKFKSVEENYDEMRAMRRLKELLQNMQKAEAIKQNWAARKIQMSWRRYKLAKLRKKKLKGRKKGKKKTPPPPGKASSSSPSKETTPASRSRSKSQTP